MQTSKEIVLRHSVQAEIKRKKFITRYRSVTHAMLVELLMFSQDGNDEHLDNVNRMVYCDLFSSAKDFVHYFGYKDTHYEYSRNKD